MDWLTFISSIVASVAWPIVLIGVVIWLRKPLERLVASVQSARYKDIELGFDRKLDELERSAERANLPSLGTPPAWVYESPDNWILGDYVERLAPISPQAAIFEAWRHLELALTARARQTESLITRSTDLVQFLERSEILPRDAASLARDLRRLRNQAVHAGDIDLKPEQAIEFGSLVERVIASIRWSEPNGKGTQGDASPTGR